MSMILRSGFALFVTFSASFVAAEPVDINCADATALATGLNGIGDAKAQAIIAHRTEMGLFKTVDDLAAVKSIGAKTVEANRANITVRESCSPPADTPKQ